jgi:hypothetical protein
MYAQGNNSGAFVLFLNLHSIKFLFRHGKIVLNVKCIDFFSLILFPPISILIFQLGKRVEEKHVGFYVIFRCSLSAQTGFGICQKNSYNSKNGKFNSNLFSPSTFVTCGRTDTEKVIGVFLFIVVTNAPEMGVAIPQTEFFAR